MQRDLEASLAETAEYKKKLEESEELNKNLRKVAQLYEAEKFAHTVTKTNLRVTNKAKVKNEMLFNIAQARLEEAEAQRKRLNDEMESTLLEIKQKAGLRSAILERKLGHLVTIMEAKETELHTLIMAMNADPAAVQESRKHLEELLCKKNTAIKELQYEVSRMAKAYVDLWGACQQKLVEELSHPVNLGIQPLNANPSLISPFNTATAEAKLLNLTSKHPGTASAVIKGKGPLGLTSIPPL
uniref:Dynein regulatory complex subunit 4 n=1 Tax=Mesocestoides corti TaxID=53468 RepID=A0A5K3FK45_MESCO